MDEYDSLDFLLFPVKRTNSYLYKEFLLPKKTQKLIDRKEKRTNKPPKESDLKTSASRKLTINNLYHNSSITIRSSASKQENYLKQQEQIIYKGRKKVYHTIKAIDSSHSCDIKHMTKYEYFFNKQEQLDDSLNMDKNVRKEKKRNARLKLNTECCSNKCTYSKKVQDVDDVEGHKSRVTIFGQLGLTEDDRYILNCAATLNDKPIQTNLMYMDNNKSFYRPDTINDIEARTTQATQVNFNFSKKKPVKVFKNKSVQCYCNNTQCSNMDNHVAKTEPEDIELKQCKSPLVVISVYPRQDSQEINKSDRVKIIRHQVSPQNKILCNTNQSNNFQIKTEQKPKMESIINTTERKSTKSRSPSPTSKTVSKEKNKNADTKVLKTNNSPRKQSPLRQKNSDKSVHKFIDIKQNNNNICSSFKNKRKPSLSKPQIGIRETNKEQVKKALVNSFLQNVGQEENFFATNNNKLFGPKDDASKITIDINGEKEHYNVLLEQRKFDTGLRVLKTVKDQSHERYKEKNVGREEGKRYNTRKSGYTSKLLAAESKINVKDSLEICHRREQRNGQRIEPKEIERKVFNARNKHYRGDKCFISDPNERDQEIRKLLGVLREKRYRDEEKSELNHPENDGDYCCRNEGLKNLTIVHNASKFPKLNTHLTKKIKKENYQGNEAMQSENYKIQNVKENVLKKQIILKKDNSLTANNVSLKTQNVLSPHIKKENQVLNPKVMVILQIEKKTKPIILTRKQYEKIKRIIKRTLSKTSSLKKRKHYNLNDIDCNVSIGNIKRKIQQKLRFNRETQTESTFKCVEIQYESQNKLAHEESIKNNNEKDLNVTEKLKEKNDSRQVLSSMEFRYASVEYIKHFSISSNHFKNDAINLFEHNNMQKDAKSIHTIFKGQRKCVTPNLGTSTFSLSSDSTNGSNCSIKPPPYSGDGKVKKTFLKRLLSCLVMRSQTSDLKDIVNQRKLPSRNSSLDSYNISTSLGALKMSSSLYDTSASFYSNHSITPISKTRRGFLNSMRGLLTIRRN